MAQDVTQLMNELTSARHEVNPRAEWVASNRARMLQHIELTTEEVSARVLTLNHVWSALSLIIPQKTVYAYVRPAVIFVLCFGLGTAGWITTVSASLNSLPGDALYPVKLATEQTQAAVVSAVQGNAASAELHLSFATRRADEVQRIVDTPSDPTTKQARVQQAVQNLKTEVETVRTTLDQATNASPQDAVIVAKAIDRKADELKQSLQTANVQIASSDTVQALDQLKQQAQTVQQNIQNEQAVAQGATSTRAFVGSAGAASTTLEVMVNTSSTILLPTVTSTPSSTLSVIIHEQPPVSGDATGDASASGDHNAPSDAVNNFPIRPPELAPNVVDTSTPVHVEAWQE